MQGTPLLIFVLLASATAAELPVRKVVLYKHGVGYFERSGELGPGESARLDFKPAEMNDVLKSLTLEVAGDNKVTSLRYDASESVAKKLAEFPLRLDKQQPLSNLLDQLKGADLELTFGTETVTGAIVGARLQAATREQAEREQVTLLLDSGELRTLDLSAAASIRFGASSLRRMCETWTPAVLTLMTSDSAISRFV